MRFNRLYNFISPVTGRILAETDYVLVGDDRGVAMPSPILIDTRLELVNLRHELDLLLNTAFVLNFPNIQLPNAQALSSLADGFMSNVGGLVSTSDLIPMEGLPDLTETYLWTGNSSNRPIEVQRIILNNFPNLTFKNIWRGDGSNRPVESDSLTTAEGNITNLQTDMSSALGDIASLFSLYSSLSSIVNDLEEGLESIGGWAAIALLQTEMISVFIALGNHTSRIEDLEETVVNINTRIDNLTVNLGGDVTGSGLLSTTIATTLTLTLDEIPLAEASVDLNDQKIITLADPTNPQDAVNLRTLEAYIDDVPLSITLVGDVTGTGVTGAPITTTLELTLDQIPLAEASVNLNDQKIINLKTDDVEEGDALNFKFLWDFMRNKVEVSWP